MRYWYTRTHTDAEDALSCLSSAVEEEVEAFLSAGAPPVYVSFAGVVVVTRKMLKIVITALVTLELRAVVDGIFNFSPALFSSLTYIHSLTRLWHD